MPNQLRRIWKAGEDGQLLIGDDLHSETSRIHLAGFRRAGEIVRL